MHPIGAAPGFSLLSQSSHAAAARRRWRAALLAAAATAWCGGAQAASCTPEQLVAKVATFASLLDHGMQEPAASRRATAARVRAVAQRRQPGTADYAGVCVAYDDLIDQLRR